MRVWAILLSLITVSASFPASADAVAGVPRAVPTSGIQDFVQNVGQMDPRIHFSTTESGAGVLFYADRVEFVSGSSAIVMSFIQGSPRIPEGREARSQTSNYYLGDAKAAWVRDAQHFESIVYPSVWPGIDLVFHRARGPLEYDFVVHSAGDAARIGLRFDAPVRPSPGGGLEVGESPFVFRQEPPLTLSEKGRLPTRFVIGERSTVNFAVEGYERGMDVVIDPVLAFTSGVPARTTSLARSGTTLALAGVVSAVGPSGQQDDVFLTLVDTPTREIIWTTYLGGPSSEVLLDVAMDGSGNSYVLTSPLGIPQVGGFQQSNGCFRVTKIDLDGNLAYSAAGGNDDCRATRIAVDATGAVVVAGTTFSAEFPVVNAFQPIKGERYDGFVMKIASGAGSVVYSSFLGGTSSLHGVASDEGVADLAVAPSGDAIAVGTTQSGNFPRANPISVPTGGSSGFVTHISATGVLLFSTFFGGSGTDTANRVAIGSDGTIGVFGGSNSANLPLLNAIQTPAFVPESGYVARFRSGSLLSSSRLPLDNLGGEISIADDGGHWMVARVDPPFVSLNAIQERPRGSLQIGIAKLSPDARSIEIASYLPLSDQASIVSDGQGGAFVLGGTGLPARPYDDPIFGLDEGKTLLHMSSAEAWAPSAPRDFEAVRSESAPRSRIDLAWAEPEDGGGAIVGYYDLWRGTDPNDLAMIATRIGTGYRDEDAQVNQTYFYQVVATNYATTGEPSAVLCVAPTDLGREMCAARDPLHVADADDDGLSDSEEVRIHRTAIDRVDTDGDGATDYQKVVVYASDPLVVDTDGDSLSDGVEIFTFETDPNDADSDDDGMGDGEEDVKTRESIPPAYAGAIDAFVVFESAGFIDLIVSAPNPEEANLRSVGLAGVLSARDAEGPLEDPLYFVVEGARSSDGLWHARYALPPEITGVDSEKISVFATDESGNGWQASGSFEIALDAPAWDTTANVTFEASGFTYRWTAADSVTSATAVRGSAAVTYELRPDVQYDVLTTALGTPLAGTLAFANDAFVLSSNAPPSFSWSPVTIGFSSDWLDRVPSQFSIPASSSNNFAAVLLPTGYPTGKGIGEFIVGFTWAGDIDTCVVQDVPEDLASFDTLFWTTSCVSVGFLVAGTVTGQPEVALGGKVAVEGVEATARAGRTGFQFLRDLVKGADECAQNANACGDVAEVAERSGKDAAKIGKLARLHEALGIDAVRAIEARNPAILDRIPAIEDGLRAAGRSDDAIKAAYKSAFRKSELGDEAATFDELTQLHKAYADNLAARAVDRPGRAIPGGFENAPAEIFENSAYFARVDRGAEEEALSGLRSWKDTAMSMANSRKNDGWKGYVVESRMFKQLAEARQLDSIDVRFARGFVSIDGKPHGLQIDGFRTSALGRVIVEPKGPPVTARYGLQLEKQAAAIDPHDDALGWARKIEWRATQGYSESFKGEAARIASQYDVTIRLLDEAGNEVTVFLPG